MAQYETRLPQQRDMGQFLEDMSELMSKHGLAKQVMMPLEGTQVGDVSCLPITLRCQGPLTQVFGFYRDLADLGRLVRVLQVSLENDDLLGIVGMEAQIVIFYRTKQSMETVEVAKLL
jgi:Tfp pilus assembly protein PilO